MNALISLLLAYLLGSLPTGLWVGSYFAHTDLREHGSGNIGFTNALRTLGLSLGLLTFAGDFLKGFFAVKIAGMLSGGDLFPVALAMVFSVLGHCYSWLLHFQGGKGVATICGAMMAYNPLFAGIALAFFFLVVALSRYVSLGSVLTLGLAAIIGLFYPGFAPVIRMALLCMCLVGIIRHKENILRLRAGTESRLGRKAK